MNEPNRIRVRITIHEVTEWIEDTSLEYGDASHEGGHAVKCLILEEEDEKTESNRWNETHMPFTFDGECEDLESAVVELCEDKLDELCENDYLKPMDFDYDYEVLED